MIKIKATLLLIVFISNLLLPLYPFLEYELNMDYIKNVLCINKDKPQSTCNGKCHLNKQLIKVSKNSQDENQKNTIPGHNLENEVFYLIYSKINSYLAGPTVKKYCLYKNNYLYQLNREHFHPPEIS